MDLHFYEDHFCLITNLLNFCRNNGNYKHLCRKCLNTYGDQSKFNEDLLGCIEQEVCNKSFLHLKQKINIKGLVYENRPANVDG